MIDPQASHRPLRLRAIHRGGHKAQAAALTGAVAPVMGAAAADLSATWPSVLERGSSLLSSPAYPNGSAFFPPARLQGDEGAPCLKVAEVGLRITEAPAVDRQLEGALVKAMEAARSIDDEVFEERTAAATLALLQQPCGVHSDKCDAGVYEVISYVHSAAPSSAPAGGAQLAMALRLRGGAITTRQQKANKKR